MTNLPREELERQANATRSRLISAVDELDRRRHEWADLADRARRAAVPIAVGVGIFVLAAAGVVVWGMSRLQRPQSRLRALRNAWAAPKPQAKPWYAELVRRIVLSALSLAGARIARLMIASSAQQLPEGDGQSDSARTQPTGVASASHLEHPSS